MTNIFPGYIFIQDALQGYSREPFIEKGKTRLIDDIRAKDEKFIAETVSSIKKFKGEGAGDSR